MKNLRLFKLLAALLPAVSLFVSGCQTLQQAMDTTPRFHEAASVNLVVRFYKWDNFFIVRPDYRDGGFLRPLTQQDLGIAFNKLGIQRDTAVVLMGWYYGPREQERNVESWKSILASQGFRRVVFLRDNDENKLDGLPIINDWKQSVEQPKQTARL